jgi:ATP-binding cassette, subfamily B, bacterial
MKEQNALSAMSWPISRLGQGLDELARRAGLSSNAKAVLNLPEALLKNQSAELGRWMAWAAERLDIEAEPVATPAAELTQLVLDAGPAVIQVQGESGLEFFLLLKSRWRTVYLIGPDLTLHRCKAEALRDVLCGHDEAPYAQEIDHLLDLAHIPTARRPSVRAAMTRERLATTQVGQCWILRASPVASFWSQVRSARLPRYVGWMLFAFGLGYALEIMGWSIMGMTTLNGQLDTGWMLASGLLMLSLIPVRLLGSWLDATFALEFGRLLKSRLLTGSLRMDIEVTRHLGAGQLLSRVMDSQALESLAFNGGMGVLVSLLELCFAATILVTGAGGLMHLGLLVVWLVLILAFRWKYLKRLGHWTLMRLEMTHELIERMVGHRTSLAQERPKRRAAQEDIAMKDYLAASKAMDQAILPVTGVMPRGWMLVGLAGLAPGLIAGGGNIIGLAIGFGGVMLANRALMGISGGLASLSSAGLAWINVAALFQSASKKSLSAPYLSNAQLAGEITAEKAGEHVSAAPAMAARVKLVDASQLVFRYHAGGEAVLRGADLAIYRGDRILLQGASGGGKSTLASMLVGLRTPESGLLLMNGLDRHTLGDTWHQLATEAPQFHENHILSGSLAFNLLMGRNWPASDDDIEEAKALCIELGLGGLIEKMPSGMMQRVGETGWQLSHGERSRIFLARALLQNAQLTILDESFAALDPQTLEKCLDCALKRARTLVVIAHP